MNRSSGLVGTETEEDVLNGDTVTFGLPTEATETDIKVDDTITGQTDEGRSQINVAFVSAGDASVLEGHKKRSSESLLNQQGASARPLNGRAADIEKYMRTQLRILLPVYNQEKDIGRTIDYLTTDLGIPHEHILASSGSTDHSDEIIRERGVQVIDQYKTLENYLNMPRFLELMRADDLKQLRGKGLTMLAGHIYNVINGRENGDTFTLQVDTDIKNIGIDEGGWDPVTNFSAYLEQDPSIDAIKAAKNGRNNQPMHIFLNTLPSLDERVGTHYQNNVGLDRWILTGEYGWKSKHTQNLRWGTGYAVETLLAMSQADLGFKRRQVAIPERRTDGNNLMTKETVMYADIQRSAIEIILSRKKFHELSMREIGGINQRRRSQVNDLMWMCHEPDANPGPDAMPNEPTQIQPGRLVPDIATLLREKIIYSGN